MVHRPEIKKKTYKELLEIIKNYYEINYQNCLEIIKVLSLNINFPPVRLRGKTSTTRIVSKLIIVI